MPVLVDPGCQAWADAPAEAQQQIEQLAVWLLWALSGRRFGVETRKVRPVQPWPSLPTNKPTGPFARHWLMPPLTGPLPLLGGGYTDARAIVWLEGPIVDVLEVRVDGQVVDPAAYQVWDGKYLVRQDGNVWPWQQRLTDPETAEGSFVVTYTRGQALPPSGQVAAGLLCCELVKARVQDPTCALPERVQHVSREGIDVQFLDPQDFVEDGRTGITAVDQWLHAVNPAKLAAPADVFSPDLPYNHRVPR
jgi:hypothetical protein